MHSGSSQLFAGLGISKFQQQKFPELTTCTLFCHGTKHRVSTSLEEVFNLVNYFDKTNHERELPKNSETLFSTTKISLYTVEGIVFSFIFKNKKLIYKIGYKCNSIRELFGVLEFPAGSKWEKVSSMVFTIHTYYLVHRLTKEMDLFQFFL